MELSCAALNHLALSRSQLMTTECKSAPGISNSLTDENISYAPTPVYCVYIYMHVCYMYALLFLNLVIRAVLKTNVSNHFCYSCAFRQTGLSLWWQVAASWSDLPVFGNTSIHTGATGVTLRHCGGHQDRLQTPMQSVTADVLRLNMKRWSSSSTSYVQTWRENIDELMFVWNF